MIRTIGMGGINWNWYVCGNFNETEKTVHVYYHDRWHKYEHRGSGHPKGAEWVFCTMLEGDKRELYGIKIGEIEYLVTNPACVFSYKDMSVYVSE
jgi:hypothetical protein